MGKAIVILRTALLANWKHSLQANAISSDHQRCKISRLNALARYQVMSMMQLQINQSILLAIDCGNLCKGACPTTDQEGFYTFAGLESRACPDASYMLTCGAEGYNSAANTVVTDAGGNAVSDFHLDSIEKEEFSPFIVQVIDADGQIVEGAEVIIDDKSMGSTDSSGKLEVQLADGFHIATASKANLGIGSCEGSLDHKAVNGFAHTAARFPRDDEDLQALGW